MLVVETIAKIRRRHPGAGESIRSIARELGVSRNTVRRWCAAGRRSIATTAAQLWSKLDGFISDLEGLLEANERRSPCDRLTLKTIWGRFGDRGCAAVRRYARQWAAQRGSGLAGAYVPLVFDPGEAFQFDWSHELVLLGRNREINRRSLQMCAHYGIAPEFRTPRSGWETGGEPDRDPAHCVVQAAPCCRNSGLP